MKGRRKATLIGGALIFFITMAAVVTVAVITYGIVSERSGSRAVISVVMLCVILLLALVCTVIDLLRRKIMVDRPVRKILEATDRIAAGDFSVRLQVEHADGRYDEYDFIMENLNRMAAELSKTEVLRSDFISNVSHELKTPLAVIRSYASSLKSGDLPPGTREKYAQVLVDASERLTSLIVNILKLNKLENQEIRPETRRVRLDEMLAEAVLRFEEAIDAKKLHLECDLEETEIVSAPDYLEIIWNNLLSNALKFTEEGGTIGVSLKREGPKAVVRISDTGCGISADTGAHIFEKFYQGDTSHSGEGNGLGLALVRKVIDLLGGEISVESEVGKGSTFTVALNGESS